MPTRQYTTILPNDWLQHLGKHRTFEITQSELLKIRRALDRAGSKDDFRDQYWTRVLVLRGDELILGVGSEIRVLNLDEVKDNWITVASRLIDASKDSPDSNWLLEIPYKTLHTPEIDFNIESIVPNPNDNLLAVTGEGKLAVVYFSNPKTGSSFECKTLLIGKKYYQDGNFVLKALWHPLSETGSHIMVLGTDSVLRMFNVINDPEAPEQTFDLSPVQRKRNNNSQPSRGIIVDDEMDADEEAVTFTLGGSSYKNSRYEPFTVYYALRNGHLYALCPVLPFNSVVCHQHLQALAFLTEAKTKFLIESCNDGEADADKRANYYLLCLQSQWLSDLLASAKRHENPLLAADSETVVIRSNETSIPYKVQRQGPVRIENDLEALHDDFQVGDLLLTKTDAVSILSVAYTNGFVSNYLLGNDIEPQWVMPIREAKEWQDELADFQSNTDVLPSASLYETIELRPSSEYGHHRITLIADPLYEDTFYAYHAVGVHKITMTECLESFKKMEESYQSGQQEQELLDALESWSMKDNGSTVEHLVDSAPNGISKYESITGLAVITDKYLTYSLLALTRTYKLVPVELSVRVKEKEDRQTQVVTKIENTQPARTNDDESQARSYDASFILPAFAPPEAIKIPDTQPKLVVPAELRGNKPVVINEESIRFLATTSEKLLNSIGDLTRTASQIQKRLKLQETECRRQVFRVQDAYDRLQNILSEDSQKAWSDKMKKATETHARLALRTDKCLRMALKACQTELTKEETSWLRTFEEIQENIEGTKGYLARIKKLREQLAQLSERKRTVRNIYSSDKAISLSSSQIALLRQALEKQSALLNDTKERLEALQKSLQ